MGAAFWVICSFFSFFFFLPLVVLLVRGPGRMFPGIFKVSLAANLAFVPDLT